MLPVCAVLLLPLAGCGGGGKGPKLALDCPGVSVLDGTQRLVDYLPGRTDAGGEIIDARITGVAGKCVVRQSDAGAVKVDFQIGFAASPGPALTSGAGPAHYALPYFVALVQGDTVIQKTLYRETIHFRPNLDAAAATSRTLSVEVPNSHRAGVQVLVGFQVTPAEQTAARTAPTLAPGG
jgi:hypothetical protein